MKLVSTTKIKFNSAYVKNGYHELELEHHEDCSGGQDPYVVEIKTEKYIPEILKTRRGHGYYASCRKCGAKKIYDINEDLEMKFDENMLN